MSNVTKAQLGLVPGLFIIALAYPFMLGVAKYSRGDWATHCNTQGEALEFMQQRMDSFLRHAADYLDGKIYDEDGQHNLAAAAWNALCVLYYEHRFFSNPLVTEHYWDVLAERQAAKAARLAELERKEEANAEMNKSVKAYAEAKQAETKVRRKAGKRD